MGKSWLELLPPRCGHSESAALVSEAISLTLQTRNVSHLWASDNIKPHGYHELMSGPPGLFLMTSRKYPGASGLHLSSVAPTR